MSSAEDLRSFVKCLLAVAADEIFEVFQQKITEYEEKLDRQNRLLEVRKLCAPLKPAVFPQQHVHKDKWVLTGLASDPLQNKEHFVSTRKDQQPVQNDQMPLSIGQEQNHNGDDSPQKSLGKKLAVNPGESEPNLQLCSNGAQEEEHKYPRDDGQVGSGSTPETEPNNPQYRELNITDIHSLTQREPHFSSSKDFRGQDIYKEEEEEVSVEQQWWNAERNSGLDHVDSKPQQIKEDHLGIAEEEDQVVQRETDASVISPIGEEHILHHPGKTIKESVVKLCRLNWVMLEPNGDLSLPSISSCEGRVIGQTRTGRRGDSWPTRQDKNKQHKRPLEGKHDAANVQKPARLNRAQASDKSEKVLKCDSCGRGFNTKAKLDIHVQIHTGGKPYVCETCGKSFTRKSDMCIHTKVHTGKKTFVCKTCGKCFTKSCNLRLHTLIHTGEKPFVCKTCDKSFTQKSHLCAHTLLHTGEKPFLCKTCGKSFAQSSTLRNHNLVHTGEKSHICTTCKKSYSRKQGLNKHMLIHSAPTSA